MRREDGPAGKWASMRGLIDSVTEIADFEVRILAL